MRYSFNTENGNLLICGVFREILSPLPDEKQTQIDRYKIYFEKSKIFDFQIFNLKKMFPKN